MGILLNVTIITMDSTFTTITIKPSVHNLIRIVIMESRIPVYCVHNIHNILRIIVKDSRVPMYLVTTSHTLLLLLFNKTRTTTIIVKDSQVKMYLVTTSHTLQRLLFNKTRTTCLPKSGLNRLVPEGKIDKCNSNSKGDMRRAIDLSYERSRMLD